MFPTTVRYNIIPGDGVNRAIISFFERTRRSRCGGAGILYANVTLIINIWDYYWLFHSRLFNLLFFFCFSVFNSNAAVLNTRTWFDRRAKVKPPSIENRTVRRHATVIFKYLLYNNIFFTINLYNTSSSGSTAPKKNISSANSYRFGVPRASRPGTRLHTPRGHRIIHAGNRFFFFFSFYIIEIVVEKKVFDLYVLQPVLLLYRHALRVIF